MLDFISGHCVQINHLIGVARQPSTAYVLVAFVKKLHVIKHNASFQAEDSELSLSA
jgi:hypothetical protein